MITLGVDLHAREARLIALRRTPHPELRTPHWTLTHAGTVTFPEGFLAETVMKAPQPLIQSLQNQLALWGFRPNAVTFTLPEGLLQHEQIKSSLAQCSRALGVSDVPTLIAPRQAVLAALAQEAKPLVAVLLHDGETEVVGLTEAGQILSAAPCSVPTDQLAVEIWTPSPPGPALTQWLNEVVQRIESFRGSITEHPTVPIMIIADHVALPHLVELLGARLPDPVRWPTPWERMNVDTTARSLVEALGPRLMPSLGAALSSPSLAPTKTNPDTTVQISNPPTPRSSSNPSSTLSGVPLGRNRVSPRAWVGWSTLLLWIPLLGGLYLQRQELRPTTSTVQTQVEQWRADSARLEQLQAFASQISMGHLALAAALRQVIEGLPPSLYLTQCHLTQDTKSSTPQVQLIIQGLTRRPQDVHAWTARVEQAGRFTARPPEFESIPPRTRFRVTFEHAAGQPLKESPLIGVPAGELP